MKNKTALATVAILLVMVSCTTTQQGSLLGGGIGAGTVADNVVFLPQRVYSCLWNDPIR